MRVKVAQQLGRIAIEGHPLNGAQTRVVRRAEGGMLEVEMREDRGLLRQGDVVALGQEDWEQGA